MSRLLQVVASVDRPASDEDDRDSSYDTIIIQTFEADHETLELCLTSTIVTSIVKPRAAA